MNIIVCQTAVSFLCCLAFFAGRWFGLPPMDACLPCIIVAIIIAVSCDNNFAVIASAMIAGIALTIASSGVGASTVAAIALVAAAIFAAIACRELRQSRFWVFISFSAQEAVIYLVLQRGQSIMSNLSFP
jgi:hypothetical protein